MFDGGSLDSPIRRVLLESSYLTTFGFSMDILLSSTCQSGMIRFRNCTFSIAKTCCDTNWITPIDVKDLDICEMWVIRV